MTEKKLTKVNLLTIFLVLAIIVNVAMAGYIISDNTSSDISDNTSSDISDNISSDISDKTSSDISDNTSSNISDNTSSNISDKTSSNISDKTSSNISDKTSSDNEADNETQTTYYDIPNITKELDEGELFKVKAAINNHDGTFTLIGKLYVPYIISESELNKILGKGTFELYNDKYIIKKNKSHETDMYGNEVAYLLYPEKHPNVYWYAFVPIEGSKNYKLTSFTQFPDKWKETEDYRQITVPDSTKCMYAEDACGDNLTDTVENVFRKELYFNGYFEFSFKNNQCVAINEVVIGC